MVLDQPTHAVTAATLFIGGQRDDDVAVGLKVLLLELNQVGDENRRHRLVVGGAARIEVAVTFDELERIEVGRPIGLERLDDVEVREEEERLRCVGPALAAVADDEVVLVGLDPAHEDVLLREPGVAKPLGHCVGCDGRAAPDVHRVVLEEFLVDLLRELLIDVELLGHEGRREGGRGNCHQGGAEEAHVSVGLGWGGRGPTPAAEF